MAPSKKIYLAVLEKLEGFMRYNTTIRSNSIIEDVNDDDDDAVEGVVDADSHMGLIEFPADAGLFELSMWFFLFPLRFVMHWTLPDVRHLNNEGEFVAGINAAFFATFMCLVWLVMGSYAMVASLEGLAELMDIPDAVIGFTVSAAGKYLELVLLPSSLFRFGSHRRALYRNFASELRGQQGRSRERIWEPSCVKRFRIEHL